MKVLVVEDEPKIARILARSLAEHGYAMDNARAVDEALSLFESGSYDLVVLDLMLPGHTDGGLEVCRRVRQAGSNVPVLMLTAINSVESRVQGLDTGADDYLGKPFDLEELHARIRALLRRHPRTDPPVLRSGDLKLDPARRAVWRGDKRLALSGKEYQVLEYLMRNKDRVISQTELLEHVWDTEYSGLSNVIEVNIRNVRRKIGEPEMIYNVRGQGYILREAHA